MFANRCLRHRLSSILLLCVFVAGSGLAQDDGEDDVKLEDDSSPEEAPVASNVNQPNVYQLPEVDGNKVNLFEPFASGTELDGRSRWVRSQSKKDKADAAELEKYDGEWAVLGTNVSRMAGDYALVLQSPAKHHGIGVKLDRPFVFNGKPFVFQYDVKFSNGQECGGAYVKLIQQKTLAKLEDLNDKTPYTIMFGPDKCGKDAHLRFIFQHRNPKTGKYEEKHWKEPSTIKMEELINSKKTHLYTLVVQPDNTFKVFIDQKIAGDGSLLTDVNPPVNPVAEIEDPNDTRPEDWDERKTIPDADAKKPDDWDEEAPSKIPDPNGLQPQGWLADEPEMIPNLDVAQPEDWDIEMDGDWEPPLIENPKCKGVGCGKWTAPSVDNPKCKAGGCGPWTRPLIDNPAYKGKWAPRKIANPDFFEDFEPYKMTTIDALALELWSISNNVVFDNILVTNDIDVADRIARQSWAVKAEMEGASAIGSFLGGININYKVIGIAVAAVIGLLTLVIIRKKSRGSPKTISMDDVDIDVDARAPQHSDEGSPLRKQGGSGTRTRDEDDIPAPELEGDEGAGDVPASASVSGGSDLEAEPEAGAGEVLTETEVRATKRRARRE